MTVATQSLERPRPGARTRRRILVVANEDCGSGLSEVVCSHAGDADAQVFVIAPVLTKSRLDYWASDYTAAEARATERLQHTLDCLARDGVSAVGELGDADPEQAIVDALHLFPADEIIVATHPAERLNWLEKRLVGRTMLGDRPTTQVVVDRPSG